VLQAARYCEEQREACLRDGQSLIFETVLSSEGKVDFHSPYPRSWLLHSTVDRAYIYDNSIDDTEARLLFRMTDGKPFKRYTDDIPLWAQTIIC